MADKKTDTTKKKIGRPRITMENGFPVGWQDIILELAAKGFSEVEMRAHLCMMGGTFNHNTWTALKTREAEFSETIQKAKCLSEAWWINKARTSLDNNTFQTGAWYACMKNMFRWRDKQEESNDDELINEELVFDAVPAKGTVNGRFEKYINQN